MIEEISETPKEKLLREIREDYSYLKDRWDEPRKERGIDMRYCMGDPWDPEDRAKREDAGRPCVSHDELRQYLNQSIGSVRQNKRGIKVDPDGMGADDKTAELHQDLIRTIEYKCGASNTYISSGFEPALRGGYGFFRITRQYAHNRFDAKNPERNLLLKDQEIIIKPLLNPDAVLFDWDCKEADWSDARKCFVLDWITKDEFRHRYPDAEEIDFTEDSTIYADWIHDEKILVAEYWRIEIAYSKVYFLTDGTVTDKRPADKSMIESERELEDKSLMQYITNGKEILRTIPQPGDIIPIIPVIGEEIWVTDESGSHRELLSLTRLARDPQMSLAYLCSQEQEEAALSPRVPYIGYVGQFQTDKDAWDKVTERPYMRLQVDPVVDRSSGQVLPLPQRQTFVPNFQAYEVAKDACRRAVQAAMGISPLPTAMQRDSQKSGVALDKIQQSQALGSYQFMDNFDRALRLAGRVIESWIPTVYDSERELTLRRADDSTYKVKLNTEVPYIDEKNQEHQYKTDVGEHHVTVSTSNSFYSQYEQVSEFLDSLIAAMPKLPIAPPQQAELLAQAIRMKQMGPRGDQMADIISPPKDKQAEIPPQVMQAVDQMKQQMAMMMEAMKEKDAAIAEMKQKLEGQVVNNEYKLQLQKMADDNKLAVAAMNNETSSMIERLKLLESFMEKMSGEQHDHHMAAHNAEISKTHMEMGPKDEGKE